MKILITGGAGYKGLKLSEALLERGHEVTVFDNFMYGMEPALFLFRHFPRITLVAKDIRNIEPGDVTPFDCVFHLAGISGYPACEANPHSAQMINVGGTDRLVSCLGRDQRLIYASTTSIYGKSDELCTEDSPVHPASLYAVTKYEGEKRCLEHANCVALRFATVFGVAPRMRWDLMPNDFVMRVVHERALVLFDSRSIRTFLHIDDAIRGYLLALDRFDVMRGQVFNVGTDQLNLSKRQLAERIKAHADFAIIDSDLTDPDVRNFLICFDKITTLDYQPQRSLDEGLRELIALFRVYRPTTPYRII
ncbi:MAG TPA: SDR family oxidoreductase [Phycisphaerae bacterium]|nr:SDR family oxidoreductase [Phycisphaerae bacterium]HPM24099.1 SDR family oxidoreductase [Phycisphaerae bacterium]